MAKRIVFDFDGVIHSYTSGWKGDAVIPDPPVEGIKEVLCQCAFGFQYNVAICSTRCKTVEGRAAIWNWLEKYNLDCYINDGLWVEKPPAVCYIDDRAICFDGDASTLADKIWEFRSYLEKEK